MVTLHLNTSPARFALRIRELSTQQDMRSPIATDTGTIQLQTAQIPGDWAMPSKVTIDALYVSSQRVEPFEAMTFKISELGQDRVAVEARCIDGNPASEITKIFHRLLIQIAEDWSECATDVNAYLLTAYPDARIRSVQQTANKVVTGRRNGRAVIADKTIDNITSVLTMREEDRPNNAIKPIHEYCKKLKTHDQETPTADTIKKQLKRAGEKDLVDHWKNKDVKTPDPRGVIEVLRKYESG